jgi:ligand-binding sensor domain-containing protein
MKKPNILLLALIFLLLHVTKVFAQVNKYKHYYTKKEVGSYFVSESDFYWENTIGIFKKNLKTQKNELIKQNFSRHSQRSYFTGMDEEGKLWIQNTSAPKYTIYDGETFRPIDTLKQHLVILPLKKLKLFVIDRNKQKWIIDSLGQLFVFNRKDVKIFKNTGINKIENISSVSIDFKQNLWLSTYKEIYKFDLKFSTLTKIDTDGLFKELGSRISIISHGIDQNDNIWVGIIPKSAIGFYDSKTAKWSKIRFDDNPNFAGVNEIVIDKNDTKWFASSNGILQYNNKDWTFFYNDETSNMASQIKLDEANNAYVSYTLGSVYKFENNTFKSVIPSDNPLESNTISNFFCNNDTLWINASKGLHKFNGKDWVSYDLEKIGNFNYKYVHDFSSSNDGTRWFGTSTGLLKLKNNNWEVFDRNNNGLNNDEINSFIFDNDKNLWIGTREGLFRYNRSFIPERFQLNPNQRHDEYINFVKKDKEGFIWAGKGEYSSLVYKYDALNGKFEFQNQTVIQSQNDIKNNLFFLTNKNILTTSNGVICIPDYKLPTFKNTSFYKMYFDNNTLWILLGNGNIIKSTSEKYANS